MSYNDFDTIDVFYEITGNLKNLTPLKIGSGDKNEIGSPIDSPIIRVPISINGTIVMVPYIPASSIKGVFRSEAEILAKKMGYAVIDISSLHGGNKSLEFNNVIIGIFGGPSLASHIIFYDAYPTDFASVRTFYKTRTAINRVIGSVQTGALVREELIAPGSLFDFKVRIYIDMRDNTDDRVTLLKRLFKNFTNFGFFIGGGKSVGYGHVRIESAMFSRYKLKDGIYTKVEENKLETILEG